MTKNATWVGGPKDGEVVVLPDEVEWADIKYVPLSLFERATIDRPNIQEQEANTPGRICPVVSGGPTGYQILWYQGKDYDHKEITQ